MKVEFRKIQGVYPVPSMRQYDRPKHRPIPRQTFWDIFVTPNDGSDDHLIFTMRGNNMEDACAQARERLRLSSKWRFFDFDTIRAVATNER